MKPVSAHVRGFTVIELMVIVSIVAILAAIAYPSLINYIRKSRLESARATIVDNIKMMERYYGAARTFECKANFAGQVGVSCSGKGTSSTFSPDLSNSKVSLQITGGKTTQRGYYDFAIKLDRDTSKYVIIATPNPSEYASSVLEKNKLGLIYYSSSASYAVCNSIGLPEVQKGSAANPTVIQANCKTL